MTYRLLPPAGRKSTEVGGVIVTGAGIDARHVDVPTLLAANFAFVDEASASRYTAKQSRIDADKSKQAMAAKAEPVAEAPPVELITKREKKRQAQTTPEK